MSIKLCIYKYIFVIFGFGVVSGSTSYGLQFGFIAHSFVFIAARVTSNIATDKVA